MWYLWQGADRQATTRSFAFRILVGLAIQNAFVLNTTLLSEAALETVGLLPEDVLLDPATGYFDHLPVVADFVISDSP